MAERQIDESQCLFTRAHLWLHPAYQPDTWLVGLTEYAQDQYSDITYIELPQTGDFFSQSSVNVVIESVKTAINLMMPVSGFITRANELLLDSPQWVNQAPYGDGWLYELAPNALKEFDDLMTFTDYDAWLDQ